MIREQWKDSAKTCEPGGANKIIPEGDNTTPVFPKARSKIWTLRITT